MFRVTQPAPTLIAANDDDAPAWARRHLGMLVDIGDMGMELARDLVARVKAETAAMAAGEAVEAPARAPAVDPALSFTRISRAVRLTISLEARMRREIEAGVFGPANDDRPTDDALGQDDGAFAGPIDPEAIGREIAMQVHRGAAKRCKDHDIRRAVEETIEAATDDTDEVERLTGELTERLEEDEFFDDRRHWPISETIAMICQDLGLDPDWSRWGRRRWARDEALASPRGSPYATYIRRPLLPNEHPRPPMERFRQLRGLPPLEGTPPPRAPRETPLPEGEGGAHPQDGRVRGYGPSG